MGKKIKYEDRDYELPEGIDTLDDLVAKYGETSARLPQLQQAAALAEKFSAWGNPDDLEARIKNYVEQQKQEAVNAARAQGATQAQARQLGAEVKDALLDQFDDMSGEQKVNYLIGRAAPMVANYVQQLAQQYWQQAQQQLANTGNMSQQQFDLLARGLALKQEHPELDIGQIWKKMQTIATARPEELMNIAYESVMTPQMMQAKEKELRAQWDAEQKTARDAENLKVLNSDSVPQWMKPQAERVSLNKDGEEAVKNNILSRFMSEGKLRPDQLH